jgi:2-oxoglutarate ferredoxin oxidoreductase subunit alpha
MNIGYIHFSEIYPLKKDVLPTEIREGAVLIGVENNATGQFSKLLKMETDLAIEKSVLKFDGRPFSVEELALQIEEKKGERND